MKKKTGISQIAINIALCFIVVLLFIPFAIMIITSLKDEMQIAVNFFGLPKPAVWANYPKAFSMIKGYFVNSFIVTGCTVAGIVAVAVPAGYVFAKFKFKGKEILYYIILAFTLIPSGMLLVPLYINIVSLHLGNTHLGVILPNIAGGSVMAILLSRGFFEEISDTIFESAKIDGARETQVIVKMLIPLSKPIVGTLCVYYFFTNFNQFMLPYIVLTSDKLKTIPIGLAKLAGQYGINFGLQMAGYSITAVPLMILFLCTSKLYVKGITSGAVKG